MADVLEQLIDTAQRVSEPRPGAPSLVRPGSVDPLGLRAINFLLMDRVFPGVNNVARHIRPFTVLAWAWRRAGQVAKQSGLAQVELDRLRDFVDRIDLLFAWAQQSRAGGADLPGREVLAPIMRNGEITFGDDADWIDLRDVRRGSTGLASPLNYGPALRALGWVHPAKDGSGALVPPADVTPAIDEFEARMAGFIDHPAFNTLEPITVMAADVGVWAEAWALEDLSDAEQAVMRSMLLGELARPERKLAVELLIAASETSPADELGLRRTMASNELGFVDASGAWRTLQVRQLFRLALEALFSWCVARASPAISTDGLVRDFLKMAGDNSTAGEWLRPMDNDVCGCIARLQEIVRGGNDEELPTTIREAIALAISEGPDQPSRGEDPARLPLAHAAREVRERWAQTPHEFMVHVLDAWVFGQHVYWSVGRGLADARNDRRLLRLRVALDDGGWMRVPGAQPGAPEATPDRLDTIINLASEAGLLPRPSPTPGAP